MLSGWCAQAKPRTNRNADQFSRTITNEPGRAAGLTTRPEFRVAADSIGSNGMRTNQRHVEPDLHVVKQLAVLMSQRRPTSSRRTVTCPGSARRHGLCR